MGIGFNRRIGGIASGGFLLSASLLFDPVPARGETLAAEGLSISRNHCARCHIVESDKPFSGISSTPSFALLVNGLEDWEDRFSGFYALRPHPAFTRIEGLENALAKNPSTVPMELQLEDVEKILAYVRTLKQKP